MEGHLEQSNIQNDIVNTESMLFEIQILISKILLRVDQTKKYIQNHKNDISELTRSNFIVYDIIKSIQILYGILSHVVGQCTGEKVTINCSSITVHKLELFLDDTLHITKSLQWYTERFLQDIRRRYSRCDNEYFDTTFYENKESLLFLMFATCKQLYQMSSPYLLTDNTSLKHVVCKVEQNATGDNLHNLTINELPVNDSYSKITVNVLPSTVSPIEEMPLSNLLPITNLSNNDAYNEILEISNIPAEDSLANFLPISNIPDEQLSINNVLTDDLLHNMQDSLSKNMCDNSYNLTSILNDPYISKYQTYSNDSDMWHGLVTEDRKFFFNRYNKQFNLITDTDLKDVKLKLASNNYEFFQSEINFKAVSHILEVYDFPSKFSIKDIERIFHEYFKNNQAEFHWITTTSGLLVLQSSADAMYVLSQKWQNAYVRDLRSASKMAQTKCWIMGLDGKKIEKEQWKQE